MAERAPAPRREWARSLTPLGSMAALAKTAASGYRSPCWNPARLVFFSPGADGGRPWGAGDPPALAPPPPTGPPLLEPSHGRVHVLLVWDGELSTSTRLAPFTP